MTSELSGVSVLLVEDSEDLRELFGFWLSSAGAQVRQESNGLAAMEAVQADAPDVIVCDLHMPGLDGCGFVARIREELNLAIPSIALTGESDRTANQMREAGFSSHLLKPVLRERLVSQVQRALGRS